MLKSPLAIASIVWLCLLDPLAAQEDQVFFDTVDVNVVNIEVVVTDKAGEPTHGLTAEDFEIYQDDVLMELTNFFAVEDRRVVGSAGLDPTPGDAAADVAVAADVAGPDTRRLNLIVFIDNLNIDPRNRNKLFSSLRSFLDERFDPRDRLMLVSMGDSIEIALPFSNDLQAIEEALVAAEKVASPHMRFELRHQQLIRDLQGATFGSRGALMTDRSAFGGDESRDDLAVMRAANYATDVMNLAEERLNKVKRTAAALAAFTDTLAGMKGRKALLYMSDGLPARAGDSMAQAWLNKYEEWISGGTRDSQNMRRYLTEVRSVMTSSRFDARHHIDELIERAAENRVSFYPISAAGTHRGAAVSAAYGGSRSFGGRSPTGADVLAIENQSLDESLLRMAEKTGGAAFTRSSNLGGLLDRMVNDYRSFYFLGYSPPTTDTEFHRLEVRLKDGVGKGLKLRHARGFRARSPSKTLESLAVAALHHEVVDNALGVALDVGTIAPMSRKTFQVPLNVKIPFKNLLLVPNGRKYTAKLEITVTVLDLETGDTSPVKTMEVPIEVPNEKILEALKQSVAYALELEMSSGAKRIAVGVRDQLAGISASSKVDIEVAGHTG